MVETLPKPEVDLAILREQARRSLYFFAKGILGFDWLVPHIHKEVCDELQDFATNRKLIELPRNWLKSTIGSIAFPIWLSIQAEGHRFGGPNTRVLIVQNSASNACKKLAVIRGLWEQNPLLRALFPELLPGRNSTWNASGVCLTRSKPHAESTYEAAGTSTKVVSRHYDVIIEDDTVAPDYDELGQESLAPTHDDVQKAIGWHRAALPLLTSIDDGLIVIIGTRWYDQDLIRYVKDNELQYKIISRACREDAEGKPDPKGHITYPERFGERVLAELERALGSYMFYCLYLNMPIRREDMAFKPEWFEFYETPPNLISLAVYTTIDTATDPKLSKSNDNDFSVVMTCGKDMVSGRIYVLGYFHARCNPGEFCSAIFDHVVRFNPLMVCYQDVAFERPIEYWLRELMRQESRYFCLQALKLPKGKDAKDLRIASLQPLFQSRAIYLRDHMKELQSELTKFPLGRHDDLADALSMQLVLWRLTKTNREKAQLIHAENDPFNFESALTELRQRKRQGKTSVVFDPVNTCGSSLHFVKRMGA